MSEDRARREQEEQYFAKKEMQLREELRQKFEEGARIKRLEDEFGPADERILKAFEEAGFNRETLVLLHFFPLLEVAWADGSVSEEERARIIEAAASRDIRPGSAAYQMLEKGLSSKPTEEAFQAARRAIRLVYESLPSDKQDEVKGNLSGMVRAVAAASGGFLGLGSRVSETEQKAIDRLVEVFEKGHHAGAKSVLDRM